MKAVDVTENVEFEKKTLFNRIVLEGRDLFDLIYSEQAGFLAFASTGIDPQMVLHLADEGTRLELKAGRHRFLFQARVSKGRISRPRLYLDYGDGFSEKTNSTVFLSKFSDDTWLAEFTTTKPVVKIRFDPSESAVRYLLVRMEIEEERDLNFRLLDSVYLGGKAFYRTLPLRIQNSGMLKSAAAALSVFFGSSRQRELERIAHSTIAHPSGAKSARQVPVSAVDPTQIYRAVYDEAIATAHAARDPSYAPLRPTPTLVAPDDPLLLAFYLPQFHPFPENDKWWGQGFTEWTNVSKAVPQFAGHYQPRLPGELGFYDLRVPEIMKRQFELARHFGISGFCFHYYWFGGKRLLEMPIEALLADKSPQMEFPFCLCWANENWTRRWDGADQDVLMQQSHTREDHRAVFQDLLRYMVDDRYIRIDGKPVIVVYRPAIIPNVDEMVKIWRDEAEFAGLPGIYLIASTAFSFDNAESIGFDAIAQFPPHAVSVGEIHDEVSLLNEDFDGAIYDYSETVDAYKEGLATRSDRSTNSAFHPGVMTSWDNEARKPGRGHIFHRATPAKFFDWLQFAMNWAENTNPPNERIVFINAWNEWAEGTYLEPDRKLGYAYLTAVGAAREDRVKPSNKSLQISKTAQRDRTSDVYTVILLHLYYTDLANELAVQIEEIRQSVACDVILTIPDKTDPETLKQVLDVIQPTRVLLCKNRGRDIWPFIEAARLAVNMGYEIACKLHSKKSPHLSNGEKWRRGLLGALTNKENAFAAVERLKRSKHIGIVAPSDALATTTRGDTMRDNQANVDQLLSRFTGGGRLHEQFVAGTMFWLRLRAIERFLSSDIGEADFGPELGAIDGTIAHAFERVLPSIVVDAGFEIASFESDRSASPYNK